MRGAVDGSRVVALAMTALVGGSAAAGAGPCTVQIAQVERQIARTAPGAALGLAASSDEVSDAAFMTPPAGQP